MSAGRPVLVASSNLTPPAAGTIVVAWKDTREARRAVTDALPFLRTAERVIVLSISEDSDVDMRPSVDDVVRFLARHGCSAVGEIVDRPGSPAEDVIVKVARDAGADLIVAGGYGHSRLREWTFGGMTRSLVSNGFFHRLFSN